MLKSYAQSLDYYSPSERLFTITSSSVNENLKVAAKEASLKRIRVHDLRHSHASLLIELGFSTLLISERLGHENIKTTLDTYSHLYPQKHAEVADKLDEIEPLPESLDVAY